MVTLVNQKDEIAVAVLVGTHQPLKQGILFVLGLKYKVKFLETALSYVWVKDRAFIQTLNH